MTTADLDDLLRHAAAHGEAVLYVPAKLVPAKGEHRRPVFELCRQRPADGAPITTDDDGVDPLRPRT